MIAKFQTGFWIWILKFLLYFFGYANDTPWGIKLVCPSIISKIKKKITQLNVFFFSFQLSS